MYIPGIYIFVLSPSLSVSLSLSPSLSPGPGVVGAGDGAGVVRFDVGRRHQQLERAVFCLEGPRGKPCQRGGGGGGGSGSSPNHGGRRRRRRSSTIGRRHCRLGAGGRCQYGGRGGTIGTRGIRGTRGGMHATEQCTGGDEYMCVLVAAQLALHKRRTRGGTSGSNEKGKNTDTRAVRGCC